MQQLLILLAFGFTVQVQCVWGIGVAYPGKPASLPDENTEKNPGYISTAKLPVDSLISLTEYYLYSYPDSAVYFGRVAYDKASKLDNQLDQYNASKVLADAWYMKDSLSLAIDFYKQSAELIKTMEGPFSGKYAERISDVGYCFYKLDIYDLAESYFEESLQIFSKSGNVHETGNQLNNLGLLYFSRGNYKVAVDYFHKALENDREAGDSLDLSICYNNIGKVYEVWGNYDFAVEHYLKSIDYLDKEQDKARIAIRLSNIGTSYFQNQDYDQAMDYLNRALEIDLALNNKYKTAIRYNEIARVLTAKKDFAAAKDYNLYALEIFQSLDRKESQAIVLNDLGQTEVESGDFPEAIRYFEESILISRSIGATAVEMKSYENLALLYEKAGNYLSALEYTRFFRNLHDTIFNAQMQKQLANYRIRYETENKEQENRLLKKDILIKKREQRTMLLIGSLMGVSILLLFFLLRLKSKKIRQDKKLYENEKKLASLEIERSAKDKQRLEELVFAEQQINKLQKDKLETKNRELSSVTLNILNKNKVLEDIRKELDQVKSRKSTTGDNNLNRISEMIEGNQGLDQDWDQFKKHFEEVHPDFFKQLNESFPDLTLNDIKLCAYLKINLTSKEMARMMNVTVAAINKSRQRLRKKLNIDANADLNVAINSVS